MLIRSLLLFTFALHVFAQAPIRGFSDAALAAQQKREKAAKALPSAQLLKLSMERMAREPHLAGSPGSKKVAEYAAQQFREWGLETQIETFEALLPYPTKRLLEIPGFHASLTEPVIAEDPDTQEQGQIPTYNAYASSGDVTAPLVYVNYGTPEDYAYLETQGVSVKGKIVIARYGRSWRGLKPKLAQDRGALGAIIYSDPRDDGFFVDNPYPDGPMRPAQGAQRGSVMDMARYTGDPLTPGWASEPGAKRLDREEARTILKIPVLPISWADAQPLLEKLQGPLAPEPWRGALPITYHLGPSMVNAHLAVDFDWTNKPLYNVIATIPGSSNDEGSVIYGNHHDAWVNGASDPVSGAVVVMETARVLSLLMKDGWQPRRTIRFALWDGEEFGLVGSTEWVEKHADELRQSNAVYLNTDSNGPGMMSAGGSAALDRFLDEVFRDVDDPRSGQSILQTMTGVRGAQPVPDVPLGALGSGSDYVGFLHHLGIASVNLGFGALPGQYHSNYDTIRFFDQYGDVDRKFAVALTQVMTTALLRLADADALPFDFQSLSQSTIRQVEELRSMAGMNVDFRELLAETGRLTTAAREFETAYAAAAKRGAVSTKANQSIQHVEQAFVDAQGLPGRDWYQNLLYAPGILTGYTAKTLPGVREAIEGQRWAEAAEQAARLALAMRTASVRIEEATQQLRETR